MLGGRVLQPAKSLWRTGLWLDSQLDPQVDEEELWVDDEHNLVLNAQGYSYLVQFLPLVLLQVLNDDEELEAVDEHLMGATGAVHLAGLPLLPLL